MSSTSVTIPAQISPAVLNRQQINSHIIETNNKNTYTFLVVATLTMSETSLMIAAASLTPFLLLPAARTISATAATTLTAFGAGAFYSAKQIVRNQQSLIDFVSILTKVLSIAILIKFLIAVTTFCGIFLTRYNHTFKLQVKLCDIYENDDIYRV